MTLQTSASPTDPLCLGEVRTYFGIPSTQRYCMTDYLKRPLEIAANQKELNLRTWALANGWAGNKEVTIEIKSGVYIYSDDVNVPALTTGAPWPNGVTLINNGFIIGKGGDTLQSVSQSGGAGISLSSPISIRNNSYIAGGGGAGGTLMGGGGAGGGDGVLSFVIGPPGEGISSGYGYGGDPGLSGKPGIVGGITSASDVSFNHPASGGGGGGRILPGIGGPGSYPVSAAYGGIVAGGTGGGAGGGGGHFQWITASTRGYPAIWTVQFITGGGGGGWGAAGGAGRIVNSQHPGSPGLKPAGRTMSGGGGGSSNQVGSNGVDPYTAGLTAGGSGGKAVALNGFAVTWLATGTRYGSIS